MKIVLIFCWFAFSLILESVVNSNSDGFKNTWKAILYHLITLPSVWISLIKDHAVKLLSTGLVSKITNWFKS